MNFQPTLSNEAEDDWRLAHFSHMAACCATLNNTPVYEVFLQLQRELPEIEADVLIEELQDSFARLVNADDVFFWVSVAGKSCDLEKDAAIREISNPLCWMSGGRYLASARTADTQYFKLIYENLRKYAQHQPIDA